jgi:hypothetical protein
MTVTPRAHAGYSKNLYELDTEGKFASNKFKFEVRFPKGDEEVETYVKSILKLHKSAGNNQYPPIRDGDDVAKKTDNEKRASFAKGHWLQSFKSDYEPALVDTKKTTLPKNVVIMGGDEVKVSFNPRAYDMLGGGVSNQLNAVMLIAKVVGGRGAAEFGEDEDGFVAGSSDDTGVEGDEDDDDF